MKKQKNVVNSKNFFILLERVALGSVNKECVIKISKGRAIVEATDMSNVMFLHCESEEIVDKKVDTEIGITNISILKKIFSNQDRNITMEIKPEKLIIKADKNSKVTLSLIEPDLVPTGVVSGDRGRLYNNDKMVLKQLAHEIPFTSEIANEFIYYSALLMNRGVIIRVKDNKVYLSSSNSEVNRFEVKMGKLKEDCDDMEIEIFREYFSNIVNVLSWEDSSNIPKLKFQGDGYPIAIIQDSKNIWSLMPAIGEDDEH